jgi:hypothetical protein
MLNRQKKIEAEYAKAWMNDSEYGCNWMKMYEYRQFYLNAYINVYNTQQENI